MRLLHCVVRRTMSLIIAFLAFLWSASAVAQTFANVTPSKGLIKHTFLLGSLDDDDYGTITGDTNVSNTNYTDYVTLTAKARLAVGIGYSGEVWVQPKFASALPAKTTTYIRVDQPTVTGLVLNLDILSNLFTNNVLSVTAYSGATAAAVGVPVSKAKVRAAFVRDTAGRLFIAVTSDSTFNAVRIGLRNDTSLLPSLVSLGDISLRVYFAQTFSAADCNGRAPFTDMGAYSSGLTVTVLDSVVRSPANAIDNSLTTASRLGGSSLLSVGVASTVSQTVYLKAPTVSTDQVRVMLSTPGTVLNLGIANGIIISAYRRDTLLSSQAVGSLLSLDLLGLLNSSSGYPIYMNPGGAFDRITVSYAHLAGVDLIGSGINIYDIRHVPARPVLSRDTVTIYQRTWPSVSATATMGDSINWYNRGGAALGVGAAFPAVDTIVTAAPYYALAAKPACGNLSDTARLYIKTIALTYTNPSAGTRGAGYSGLVLAAAGTGVSGAAFRFTLVSGSLPAGMTLFSNGTIGGTPTVTDTVSITVNLRDTVNNLDAGNHVYQVIVRAPVQLPATTLPAGTGGTGYTVTLNPANGGTGTYTYALTISSTLPSGLSFNPLTREISGTTAPGTYTFSVQATDEEDRRATQSYSLLIGEPLPVYLVAFKGQLAGEQVKLDWQVTNEADIDFMELQRTGNGSSWQSVYTCGVMPAADGRYEYQEVRATPVTEQLLYRLRIGDRSGGVSYSPVVRILAGTGTDLPAPVLFPNPAAAGSQVWCSVAGSLQPMAEIQVYNALGQLVYQVRNTAALQTEQLAPGVYQLRIVNDAQQVSMARLVID